jgi:hypothetical protein
MAANGKTPVVTCAGCGKQIQSCASRKSGDRPVDIRIGRLLEVRPPNGKRTPGRPRKMPTEDFRSESTWGRMHLNCFLRAIESPGQLLAELGL